MRRKQFLYKQGKKDKPQSSAHETKAKKQGKKDKPQTKKHKKTRKEEKNKERRERGRGAS